MLVGLFKFLIWFFCIVYFLKILGRIFAPILIKYFSNKLHKRFNQQHQDFQESQKKEGEVTFTQSDKSKKKRAEDVGDYVDFEEIEE